MAYSGTSRRAVMVLAAPTRLSIDSSSGTMSTRLDAIRPLDHVTNPLTLHSHSAATMSTADSVIDTINVPHASAEMWRPAEFISPRVAINMASSLLRLASLTVG